MRHTPFAVVALLVLITMTLAAPTAPPATSPATQPATSPAAIEIADGAISFVPPGAGWTQAAKSANGRLIAFVLTKPVKATMAVNADHQDLHLDDSAAAQIGAAQCKRIVENAKKAGDTEILEPPRVEPDERFFLRVHHRFQKGGNTGDQLQLYRVLGRELVAVAVTAYTDSTDDAKAVFDEAEKVMLSVMSARSAAPSGGSGRIAASAPSIKPPQLAGKPIALSQAKIRVAPPDGWRIELSDTASGMAVAFRDPLDSTNLVAVSVRPLPKEAKSDPQARDAIATEMANGEKAQFKIDGGEPDGETQTITDRRFLHKTRTRYRAAERRFDISSRQLRAGDVLVSVSVVALDDKFETIDKLADQVALSIRAATSR